MKGSTYKRCKCRDEYGKELGSKCPKLRRANGTWNPKHARWYFQLELEPGPGGRRQPLRRGGFDTQDEAQEALDEAKEKAKAGVNVSKKITVGQYLDRWIKGKKRTRANTNRGYESIIRVHLIPHLGHIQLDKLRVDHLRKMFEAIDAESERQVLANAERRRLREVAKAAGWARDGKARKEALAAIAELPRWKRPTGPVTKHRIREVLRNALNDAKVPHGLVVNVAELAELESATRSKAVVWTAGRTEAWSREYGRVVAEAREAAGGRQVEVYKIWQTLPTPSEVMVWTPEQTGIFLEYAARHRLYAAYYLIAFTGLRRSEACGGAWEDLDLAGRELVIRVGRVQVGWEVEEGDPKSESSRAPVALAAGTIDVLKAHRKRQREERVAWEGAWVDSGKLFTQEDGAALHPSTLSKQFDRLSFEAGLPRIRLHDLRHGAATLALAAGVDMKVISAMLRHSSTGITADIYTSVLPDVARNAAEAVVAMVPRKSAGGESGTFGLPSGSPARRSLITRVTNG